MGLYTSQGQGLHDIPRQESTDDVRKCLPMIPHNVTRFLIMRLVHYFSSIYAIIGNRRIVNKFPS